MTVDAVTLTQRGDGTLKQVQGTGRPLVGYAQAGSGVPWATTTQARLNGQTTTLIDTGEIDAATGMPRRITSALGAVSERSVDPVTGEVLAVIQGAGADAVTTTVMARDAAGHPTQIRTVVPAAAGRAQRVMNAGCTYTLAGRLATSTGADGVTTTYGYDAGQRLTTIDSPTGTITQGYDAAGNLVRREDAAHRITTWSYDPLGRLLQSSSGGETTRYEYDSTTGRQTRTIGPDGRVVGRSYDDHGRVSSVWVGSPGQVHHSYQYDALGRVTAILRSGDDPASGGERFAYDSAADRLLWRRDRLGQTTTPSYDPATGQATGTTTVVPGGTAVTRQESLATTSVAGGGFTLTRTTSDPASGAGEARVCDARGRLLALTLPGQATIGYAYDAAGRLLQRGGLTYTYDAADHLVGIQQGGQSATLQYDPGNGRLSTLFLPNQVQRSLSYDGAGLLSGIQDSVGGTFAVTGRDGQGRIRGATGPDYQRRFQYRAGRLVGEQRGGTDAWAAAYAYDANGDQTERWTWSTLTQHADAFATAGVPADLQVVSGSWTATGNGHLTASSGRVATTVTSGQTTVPLTTVTIAGGSGGIIASTGGTTAGVWLVKRPDPNASGHTLAWLEVRVASGAVILASPSVSYLTAAIPALALNCSIGADSTIAGWVDGWPDDRLVTAAIAPPAFPAMVPAAVDAFTLATDPASTALFDVTAWQWSSAATTRHVARTYDGLERLAGETDTINGVIARRSFTYDGADRLTAIDDVTTGVPAALQAFGYDAFGRTTSSTVGGATVTWTYGLTGPQRLSETAGGTTTSFVMDDQGLLGRSGSGWTQSIASDGRQPLWSTQGSQTTTYVTDVLGDVVGEIGDLSQSFSNLPGGSYAYAAKFSYDAYGSATTRMAGLPSQQGQASLSQLIYVSAATSAGPRFKGLWWESNAGRYRTDHRLYDPFRAGFTSVDPAKAGAVGWYAYCGGDPINRSDPSGLAWDWVDDGWKEVAPFNSDRMPGFKGAAGWHVEAGVVTMPNPRIAGGTLHRSVETWVPEMSEADRLEYNARAAEWNQGVDAAYADLRARGYAQNAKGNWTKGGVEYTMEMDPRGKWVVAGGEMALYTLAGIGPFGKLPGLLRFGVELAGGSSVETGVGRVAGREALERATAQSRRLESSGVAPRVEAYTRKYEDAVAGDKEQIADLLSSLEKRGIRTERRGQAQYGKGVVGYGDDTRRWEIVEEFVHSKVDSGWAKAEIEAVKAELLAMRRPGPGGSGVRTVFSAGDAARSAEEIVVKRFLLRNANNLGIDEAEKSFLKSQLEKLAQSGTVGGY